ncbi:MAG: potassium channel family protein [Ktedonobacterales bacterium]
MAEQSPPSASSQIASPRPRQGMWTRIRSGNSYGLVLLLILLDYLLVSIVSSYSWGRVIINILLGFTLLVVLYIARTRRIWQVLAGIYLIVVSLYAVIAVFVPSVTATARVPALSGGLLLIFAPVAILRRVIRDTFVSVETILGAVSVYLLLGFSFASVFATIGSFSPSPFFAGYSPATANDYLFFSYTTLTTVGYGNLVPAGTFGRTFAMVEALLGQIYLVIVVARLVSLWGQNLPPRPPRKRDRPQAEETEHDVDASTHPLERTGSSSGTV